MRAALQLWWAVWGHRKVRRVLLAGYANPAQFTTSDWRRSGDNQTKR